MTTVTAETKAPKPPAFPVEFTFERPRAQDHHQRRSTLFIATDVCKVLDIQRYQPSYRSAGTIDEKGACLIRNPWRTTELRTVNEIRPVHPILRSDKPNAKKISGRNGHA